MKIFWFESVIPARASVIPARASVIQATASVIGATASAIRAGVRFFRGIHQHPNAKCRLMMRNISY